MIVTTGKSIRIESGHKLSNQFERTSEHPGIVTVTMNRKDVGNGIVRFELPANKEEAEQFIAAYRRCLEEEVGYRDRNVE